MNSFQNNRNWVILSWNVRDINSESKWEAIKSKALEAKCDIMCLQETKRESFDIQYVKKFCPRNLNDFVFLPSVSHAGGSIIV